MIKEEMEPSRGNSKAFNGKKKDGKVAKTDGSQEKVACQLEINSSSCIKMGIVLKE